MDFHKVEGTDVEDIFDETGQPEKRLIEADVRGITVED